jgi:hypothetical protein
MKIDVLFTLVVRLAMLAAEVGGPANTASAVAVTCIATPCTHGALAAASWIASVAGTLGTSTLRTSHTAPFMASGRGHAGPALT